VYQKKNDAVPFAYILTRRIIKIQLATSDKAFILLDKFRNFKDSCLIELEWECYQGFETGVNFRYLRA
jgi:hypothetical protein